MPKRTETKSVQRETTKKYYQCDHPECDVESTWKEDMNYVVLNPELRGLTTPNADQLSKDGVSILCDSHLEDIKQSLPYGFDSKHFQRTVSTRL